MLHIHGLGESGISLEPVAMRPELESWRHLIPDLPGYGRSLWPSGTLPLESVADELARWLARRMEHPVVVLGHSMGGVLATLFAERHRGLCRAIVDVEGNKSIADCSYSSRADAVPLPEFLEHGFQKLLDGVYRAGFDRAPLRGYFASMRFADPRTLWQHSRELVTLSTDETLAVRLARTGVPVLYIAGTPEGAGPRTLELVRSAGISSVVLEPAGHWPFLDLPAEFARAVADFLSALPPL